MMLPSQPATATTPDIAIYNFFPSRSACTTEAVFKVFLSSFQCCRIYIFFRGADNVTREVAVMFYKHTYEIMFVVSLALRHWKLKHHSEREKSLLFLLSQYINKRAGVRLCSRYAKDAIHYCAISFSNFIFFLSLSFLELFHVTWWRCLLLQFSFYKEFLFASQTINFGAASVHLLVPLSLSPLRVIRATVLLNACCNFLTLHSPACLPLSLLYVAVNLYLNDFSFALGIINYQCQALNGAAQTADRLCIGMLSCSLYFLAGFFESKGLVINSLWSGLWPWLDWCWYLKN